MCRSRIAHARAPTTNSDTLAHFHQSGEREKEPPSHEPQLLWREELRPLLLAVYDWLEATSPSTGMRRVYKVAVLELISSYSLHLPPTQGWHQDRVTGLPVYRRVSRGIALCLCLLWRRRRRPAALD